jgi:clathrin heavy chain
VAPEFISFKNTTMESDRYVCVRETGAQNTVVIVDLLNPTAPAARRPITADSALMCPDKKVIALRAASPAGTPGDALQVFNLDTKTKLKAFSIAESVEFWKWVSPSLLGIVTPTACYHWDVASGGVDAPPVKVFDRTQNLGGAQIISYRVSGDGKWCALVGIAPGSAERPALARGVMQLFSQEQAKSQPLEAHAAAFATARFAGRPPESAPSTVIAFAQKTVREGGAVASKLHVIELGTPPGGGAPQKRQAELFFPAEFADDFPVSLQVSDKYGLVYVVTKLGLLFVYDLETATAVYRNRISPDPIFLAAPSDSTGGVLCVNRRGQVLLATVNEPAVVPFVAQQLGNLELAMSMAKKGGLPGAEALVGQQFEKLCSAGSWKEAAECAAESPQGSLRTPATLERLRAAGASAQAGQKPPILVYLGLLLARGKLNAAESAELGRLTMRQGRKELLLGWWRDGKLEPGEELGDLLTQAGDKESALKCYQACGASGKVIVALAESGDAAALAAFTGQSGARLDYVALLQQLMMTNPSGAVSLAKMAVKQTPPAADPNAVADLFLQRNMVREATAFLLDYLSADRPSDAALQTKLLEVNLVTNPQVADAVLANGQLTHYDRPKVAQLCEKAGLYLRALQHYTDLKDIRRVVVQTHALDPAALTEWFGSLSAEWALECLKELLVANPQGNLQLVVNIAREYSEQLGAGRIVQLLEAHGSFPGLYLFLGGRLAASEDPDEHYKYIEAAARTGQLKEVERVTRESAHYPPERVKTFLMEAKLPDAR